jgi:hypothetical protein
MKKIILRGSWENQLLEILGFKQGFPPSRVSGGGITDYYTETKSLNCKRKQRCISPSLHKPAVAFHKFKRLVKRYC